MLRLKCCERKDGGGVSTTRQLKRLRAGRDAVFAVPLSLSPSLTKRLDYSCITSLKIISHEEYPRVLPPQWAQGATPRAYPCTRLGAPSRHEEKLSFYIHLILSHELQLGQ